MNIEHFAAGILGACIAALVAALVFIPAFRADMVATQEGELSIAGLSVRGTAIVVLIVFLGAALTYVAHRSSERRPAADSSDAHIAIEDLPFEAKNKAEAKDRIKALHLYSHQPLATVVGALNFDSAGAEDIRKLAVARQGPWGASDKARETYLRVPAKIRAGEASACPRAIGRSYEIRSRLPRAFDMPGESVVVKIAGVLISSNDCDQKFDFIHVSCDIASKVLSDRVVECDARNQPRWKNPYASKAPIYLTEVAP